MWSWCDEVPVASKPLAASHIALFPSSLALEITHKRIVILTWLLNLPLAPKQ